MGFRPKDEQNQPPPPTPDLSEVMDNIQMFAEVVGGQRRTLMAQGFTDREAAQICVAFYVNVAADTWKEVGLQWGLNLPK